MLRVANSRTVSAPTIHPPTASSEKVTRARSVCGSSQRSESATSTAGAPVQSSSRKIRRSKREEGRGAPLEAMARQAPVQRAAAEPEVARREAHVAAVPLERLPDEYRLHLFQREVVERPRRRLAQEPEVG